MGIEGVENLKPDEVEELHPEWPMVRCIECGHVYELVLTEVDQKEAVQWIEGNCPKCHNPKFNTCVNNFKTMNGSILFDKGGVTAFRGLRSKTVTIDKTTIFELKLDPHGTTGFTEIKIENTLKPGDKVLAFNSFDWERSGSHEDKRSCFNQVAEILEIDEQTDLATIYFDATKIISYRRNLDDLTPIKKHNV